MYDTKFKPERSSLYAPAQQPSKQTVPVLDLETGASAIDSSGQVGTPRQLQIGSTQPAASSAGAVTAASDKLKQSSAWHAHVEHIMSVLQSKHQQQGPGSVDERSHDGPSQGNFATEEVQALQSAASLGAVWVEACIKPVAAKGSNLMRRILINQLFRSFSGLAGSSQHQLQPKIDTLEVIVPVFL